MKATRMSALGKTLMIGWCLLLAVSAWGCVVEPELTETHEEEVIGPIPIILPKICDNVFSDPPCKNKAAGAACAPPVGGQCTAVAPIGNGFYDCICALPPPPPPPPPGDGGAPPPPPPPADGGVPSADGGAPSPSDASVAPVECVSPGACRESF